jgi:hypothetical protein
MIKMLVLSLILSPWIFAIVFVQGGATGALQGALQDIRGPASYERKCVSSIRRQAAQSGLV